MIDFIALLERPGMRKTHVSAEWTNRFGARNRWNLEDKCWEGWHQQPPAATIKNELEPRYRFLQTEIGERSES